MYRNLCLRDSHVVVVMWISLQHFAAASLHKSNKISKSKPGPATHFVFFCASAASCFIFAFKWRHNASSCWAPCTIPWVILIPHKKYTRKTATEYVKREACMRFTREFVPSGILYPKTKSFDLFVLRWSYGCGVLYIA